MSDWFWISAFLAFKRACSSDPASSAAANKSFSSALIFSLYSASVLAFCSKLSTVCFWASSNDSLILAI